MIEIDKLEAGPELDALVAEKLMGKTYCRCFGGRSKQPFGLICRQCGWEAGGGPYSGDIAAAMEVVAKLQEILIERHKPPSWPAARIEFTWQHQFSWNAFVPGYAMGSGNTLPLAICRAALQAVGP